MSTGAHEGEEQVAIDAYGADWAEAFENEVKASPRYRAAAEVVGGHGGAAQAAGDLATLVRFTRASQELTECTARMAVIWPDALAAR